MDFNIYSASIKELKAFCNENGIDISTIKDKRKRDGYMTIIEAWKFNNSPIETTTKADTNFYYWNDESVNVTTEETEAALSERYFAPAANKSVLYWLASDKLPLTNGKTHDISLTRNRVTKTFKDIKSLYNA